MSDVSGSLPNRSPVARAVMAFDDHDAERVKNAEQRSACVNQRAI
ncbi:MAG: hypothetical protein ACJAQ8_001803 [Haliea salexigens]|jgi:hypothetical protein